MNANPQRMNTTLADLNIIHDSTEQGFESFLPPRDANRRFITIVLPWRVRYLRSSSFNRHHTFHPDIAIKGEEENNPQIIPLIKRRILTPISARVFLSHDGGNRIRTTRLL